MAQKKVTPKQIESGKEGFTNIGERMDGFDQSIANINTEAQLINETVMAMASAPVTTPVFNDVETYTVDAEDIVAEEPVVITIPNSKTYKVGKNNLLVLRNGIQQTLGNGDYTENSATTVQFGADILEAGDVITFIIGNATKLNYSVAVTYYAEGGNAGKIHEVSYTGDIVRGIAYTYNAAGKIATEAITEDGKTTTKTYTYDETSGKITGVTAVVS